jgi:hypothetical protein
MHCRNIVGFFPPPLLALRGTASRPLGSVPGSYKQQNSTVSKRKKQKQLISEEEEDRLMLRHHLKKWSGPFSLRYALLQKYRLAAKLANDEMARYRPFILAFNHTFRALERKSMSHCENLLAQVPPFTEMTKIQSRQLIEATYPTVCQTSY